MGYTYTLADHIYQDRVLMTIPRSKFHTSEGEEYREDFTVEEIDNIEQSRKQLNNDFCRRCGYCQPCPVGINIPLMFLCEGYYLRYNLKDWAKSRYKLMKVLPSKCIKCGKCELTCPQHLKIRELLVEVSDIFDQ